MSRKRAYIVGAISSDKQYRQKFADCQMVLEFLGYAVFNPAILPDGWGYRVYMQADECFLRAADVIVLLPDWRKSRGGRSEVKLAKALGKEIVNYKDVVLEGI